jgi:hypothetical protein
MTYATAWPVLTSTTSVHVDPSTIPLEQLARIRGAMWTARLDIAYGPRPFQPTNINALEFLHLYPPTERHRMIAAYKQPGYTHTCVGPANGQGYHTDYPDVNFIDTGRFEEYLDLLELHWDNGLVPINFVKGDFWTLADLKHYEPLFMTPRAQRLMRVVVPGGWEPDRETPSHVWRDWLEWAARVFPRSLRLLHMVADHDAPGSSSEGFTNDQLWHNVIHLLHGWLTQSFAFEDPTKLANDGKRTAFQEWRDSYDIRVTGSYPDRFVNGYAGWPTHSAWGNRPLKVYAGEYAAYWCYNDDRPEAEAQAWGDAAMAVGADGYLDGGTVPVP